MKKLALAALLGLCTLPALAEVTVAEAWVRATVPQQKATGAFMHLKSDTDARLVAAESPVAAVVEIHEMVMENDVMKMREIPGGLEIAKGRTMSLKPGGYHVMLMDLKQQIKGGDTVPVTLTFEEIGSKKRFTQEVKAPVTALGAGNAAPAAMQHGKH